MFYNEEGKIIVPQNIGELLTARGLCYWFCDDGYKTVSGLYLCTESFTALPRKRAEAGGWNKMSY